jgi:membrane-associated phospholipid phosphatase
MPPSTLAAAPTVPLPRTVERETTDARAPRIVASVVAVLGGTATVALLYVLAVVDPAGRAADHAVMRAAMRLGAGLRGDGLAMLGLVGVPAVALAVVVLAGVALVRRRGATAIAVVAIVLGAQLVTQLLKAGLARPDSADPNSLPSGHVTLVASLGVALVLVVPRLLRPLAATVALVVTAVAGTATLVVGWHRPSDVLAALAVVVAVTGVVGLVRAVTRSRGRPVRAGDLSTERGRPRSA